MNESRARNDDRRGKSAKAVLAASARTRTVATWITMKNAPSPTTTRATCESTVFSSDGSGTMPIVLAMKLMPRNRAAKIPAAQTSVMRALRHSGGLKAGTPSEIASTPVRAAAPELNARRMRRMPSASPPASALSHSLGGVYSGNVPVAARTTPMPTIARIATMYR